MNTEPNSENLMVFDDNPAAKPAEAPLWSTKWDTIHTMLENWRQLWHGDKASYGDKYPAWMLDAAAELFAHDMCDAWDWNDYVKVACVIISRHYELAAVPMEARVKSGTSEPSTWGFSEALTSLPKWEPKDVTRIPPAEPGQGPE